jgi:hypothetical protein
MGECTAAYFEARPTKTTEASAGEIAEFLNAVEEFAGSDFDTTGVIKVFVDEANYGAAAFDDYDLANKAIAAGYILRAGDWGHWDWVGGNVTYLPDGRRFASSRHGNDEAVVVPMRTLEYLIGLGGDAGERIQAYLALGSMSLQDVEESYLDGSLETLLVLVGQDAEAASVLSTAVTPSA